MYSVVLLLASVINDDLGADDHQIFSVLFITSTEITGSNVCIQVCSYLCIQLSFVEGLYTC